MPKPSDVGVIVGRFQVHELHAAHLALIQSVCATHRHTVVVLGLSPVRVSYRNPLDFEARKQMLLAAFPKLTVLYLKDEPSDQKWSAHLDALIDDVVTPAQTVTLYGGRDSFLSHYCGRYSTDVLEPDVYASGTELRKTISKGVKASPDFRAGVIWASANGYPKVFPTVDVAIWRPSERQDGQNWLLVRKPTESLWRFPGGFVQPSDASYEFAARREVMEETGIEIGNVRYVGSFNVDDWRYRDEADKIMTTLFLATLLFGSNVRPADDVSEAAWFSRAELDGNALVSEHKPLWDAVKVKGGLQ